MVGQVDPLDSFVFPKSNECLKCARHFEMFLVSFSEQIRPYSTEVNAIVDDAYNLIDGFGLRYRIKFMHSPNVQRTMNVVLFMM